MSSRCWRCGVKPEREKIGLKENVYMLTQTACSSVESWMKEEGSSQKMQKVWKVAVKDILKEKVKEKIAFFKGLMDEANTMLSILMER